MSNPLDDAIRELTESDTWDELRERWSRGELEIHGYPKSDPLGEPRPLTGDRAGVLRYAIRDQDLITEWVPTLGTPGGLTRPTCRAVLVVTGVRETSLRISTARAERDCTEWLREFAEAGDRPSQAKLREQAQTRWPNLSGRGFDRCWREAGLESKRGPKARHN